MVARRPKPKGRSGILREIAAALTEWAKFCEERRERYGEAKAARQKAMTLMVENYRLLKWCRDNLSWDPEMNMVFTCLGKAEVEWDTMKHGNFVGWTQYFIGRLAWPGGRSFRDQVNRWADEVEKAERTGEPDLHANSGAKPYNFGHDTRSGTWYGIECSFTPTQAPIVRLLLEAYEAGTPEVDAELLIGPGAFTQAIRKVRDKKPSAAKRVRDLFRRNPAWGKVIVPGTTRGTYHLKKP